MVLKDNKRKRSKKSLISYFLKSKTWKKYEGCVTNNISYWIEADPERASKMLAARIDKRQGYSIADYLYDMLDCLFRATHLSVKTRERLVKELSDIELYHKEFGTLENML